MSTDDEVPDDNERYIGDGVYASFDGVMIKLRTQRFGADEVIYLEPSVYAALVLYAEHFCWPKKDTKVPT